MDLKRMRLEKIPNSLKKKRGIYLKFTWIFLIVVFFSFLEFLLNHKAFLVSDTLSEYVTSLAYWGNYLRNTANTFVHTGKLHFPQWDFSLGLGSDIISTLNWYVVGDPLTLLAAFVKPDKTIYLHHFLVVLRLYLAGMAFLFYCRRTKRSNEYSVCGAIIYVFSGYSMFLAYRHTYFINSFIYLPFLYAGIEKIFQSKNPIPFIVTVFVSCAANFYFFYILTILTFIYALVRFFFIYTDERLRNFARCFTVSLFAYMIGVFLAAVIFLPNVSGFLDCGRSGSMPHLPLFYNLKYYFKIIVASISPSYIESYTRLGFAPVFLPLLILCFIRKECRELKFFACIYLIFLLFPFFGSAFNGFGYITNRWGFAISFFAGILAVQMLPEITHLGKNEGKFVLGIPAVMCLMVFAGAFFPGEIGGDIKKSVLLSYLILAATLIAIFCLNKHKNKVNSALVPSLILAMICFSVTINAYEFFSPKFVNYIEDFFDTGWENHVMFDSAENLVLEIQDENFFRYEYPQKKLLNNSMIMEKNGTSFYFSEISRHILDFFELYGLYTGDEQHLRGFDNRTALQTASCVKYYIQNSERQDVPQGFFKIKESLIDEEKYNLYENKNFLPIGFLYKSFISEEDFYGLDMVEREAEFLNVAVVHGEREGLVFESPVSAEIVKQNEFSIRLEENTSAEGNSYFISKDNSSIYVNFVPRENAANYLVLEDVYFTNDDKPRISVYLDGKYIGSFEIKENFSRYGHRFAVNLGNPEFETNCTVQLLFHEKGLYNIENMHIDSLPHAYTNALIDNARQHVLEDVVTEDDFISGKINADSASMLFLSIPFSKGWKAFVDGIQVPLYRTQVMYSGLFLEQGEHIVTLKYSNPLIKAGFALSLLGFALLVLVILKYKRSFIQF
ncbi:MAG: YfhO family protein [Bacteroides sp.]|nr:YfhO family protein [Prevotella sp.]MCM1407864.1 YfhO family protein [Treponema brennaborense]MCM1469606.1 YfhO family protein [Bacteroides sp.]